MVPLALWLMGLFCCDKELLKHSELALKATKNTYLTSSSTYSTFLYQKEAKQWESQRTKLCKIVIQDVEKVLTKNDFSTVDYVVNNIERLIESGKQAINSFAFKYKNTDVLLSYKSLLSIHFDINKSLEEYHFLYEVAKDSFDWKVVFEKNEVVEVQRVK